MRTLLIPLSLLIAITLPTVAVASPSSTDSILSLIDIGGFKATKSFLDKTYYLMNEKERGEYLKRIKLNYPEIPDYALYEYSYDSSGYTYSVFYITQSKKCTLAIQQTDRLRESENCRVETSRCTRSKTVNVMECFEKVAKKACDKFSEFKDPDLHDIPLKYCEKVFNKKIGDVK